MDVLSLCGSTAVLGELVALAIVIAIALSPDRGIRHMRRLQFAVLLFVCAFATGAAAEYPDRPIHLIVPQAAGSATDTVARILGAALADEIGQQIIVDDRPGGALTVGLDLTAKSAPDGYTLCMGPIGALAITRASGGEPAL